MSKYTTGEMAKLCDVSVRTVQFYDTKGLLVPSELTEGGRRLYSDDDLMKMRLICILKSIGLSLDSIKGILESVSPGKVLTLLLDEQAKQLNGEIEERKAQLETIKAVKNHIGGMTAIPVNTIIDIDRMMKNKKGLRKVHGTMFAVGIAMMVIQWGAVLLWIFKGLWIPFAIGMPFVILFGLLITRMYHRNTAYICLECTATFKPTLKNLFLSAHKLKVRKLACTKCGHKGYCVEVYATDCERKRKVSATARRAHMERDIFWVLLILLP